ncbi:nuclear pore complex protein Nup153 isoform X2 [Cimex lectularius]|uniref:Nuclear pore complex protein Nup153 n=1 Tax=Cimex lectularius TaxID=79782 RepID=A0A8I6SJ50_CIMLE|nr:nuclear pore complex protein Nup153 isoform X2 [Cimex lectularius]
MNIGADPVECAKHGSSFVRRITTRVTEILPQPSTWISRWLSPATKPDLRNDSDEEDEDEDQRQPAKKRPCLNTSVDFPQNHIYRIGLGGEAGDISPILSNRIDNDKAIPGPSGLHLSKKTNFVFSTPAPAQTQHDVIPKINGDEGSDGESTSGCSSVGPQGEKAPSSTYAKIVPKSRPPLHSTATNVPTPSSSPSPSLASNLQRSPVTSRPTTFSKLDFNVSKRPSFDSFVFNNPLNKSLTLNSSRNSSLNDSSASPFYKGRTMYGGSSSCREALNSKLLSPRVSGPKVVSVKPSATPEASKERIGASAMRILKALEQFSTPMPDPRKTVGKSEGEKRKRKSLPPYEELILPQMPDLLRIKRKERPAPPKPPQATIDSVDSTYTTNKDLTSSDRLRIPNPEERNFIGCIRGRKMENLELERAKPINLPNVKLPITTLPNFTFQSLPKADNPSEKRPQTVFPNLTEVPLSKSSSSKYKFSKPIIESSDGHSVISIKPTIKFSEPLNADANEKISNKTNISSNVTISSSSTSKDSIGLLPSMKTPSPTKKSKEVMFDYKPMAKLKEKKVKETEVSVEVKPSAEFKNGSVMDFFKSNTSTSFGDKFKAPKGSWACDTCLVNNSADKSKCAACETPKPCKKEQIISSSTSSDNKWECKNCKLENSETEEKCKSCGAEKNGYIKTPLAKGLQAFIKDKDTWECKECFVKNKMTDNSCVACTSSKPGSSNVSESSATVTTTVSSSAPSLSSMFKKPEGNWECDVCLVSNKAGVDACVSCSTPKPGAKPAESKPAATFQFGIPPATTAGAGSTSSSAFSLGNTSTIETSKPATSGFTFGIPCTENSKKIEFKFGIPPPVNKDKEESSTSKEVKEETSKETPPIEKEKPQISLSSTSSTPTSNLFSFGSNSTTDAKKDPSEVTEEGAKLKKRVRFGDPLVEQKTISSDTDKSPFSFGKVSTKNDKKGNVFGFSQQPPMFGNTSIKTSLNSSEVPNTNSLFKFSSDTSSVSSTTETTNTPPNATNSEAGTTNTNIFGAVLNNATTNETSNKNPPSFSSDNKNLFGGSSLSSASEVKKPLFTDGFGSMSNKNIFPSSDNMTKDNKLIFGSNAKPIFGASNETGANAIFCSKQEEKTPLIFGNTVETPSTMFGADDSKKDDKNTIAFGSKSLESIFGKASVPEEKKLEQQSMFTSKPGNSLSTQAQENNLFTSKIKAFPQATQQEENKNTFMRFNTGTNFFNNNNMFASKIEGTAFDVKPATTSSVPSFGNPIQTVGNSTENKPTFSFNSMSNQPSSTGFGMFNKEPENKPLTGGFSFNMAAKQQPQQQPPQSTNNFGFGSSSFEPTPVFNNQNPPQTSNAVFTFGSSHQEPQQPMFAFQQGQQANTMASPFAFGSQNSVASQPQQQPVQPPMFDPNIKPNFNFSGGSTPTFSAPTANPDELDRRKIRKAFRRTRPAR